MPPWRRSAWRRATSASGRSTPSDARSCATPASPSSRWSIARRCWREVAPWADEAALLRLDTVVSRLKVELGVSADEVAADPDAGPVARAFVAYERAVAARGGLDFDDLILRAIAGLEREPRAARALAVEVPGAARRRGPGRRSGAAPAGAPAGRAGQPDLPRRRRRPVDLRLAAGGRPADPRPRRSPARPPSGRPRGQLPVPAPGRRTRRPARRAQRRALREGHPAGPGATGRLILAPDASDEIVRLERAMRTWPDDGSTRAVLARTNRELLPAVVVALGLGVPVPRATDRPAARVAHRRQPARRRRRASRSSASRCW